jgi:beta-phosphoglucomutase-like phosphatase (HAD superfamily)
MHLLEALAQERGQSDWAVHLLVPWEARKLLGLPGGVTACVFDLEGVLIASAAVHAAAWTETFDQFIWARTERTGGHFAPFNPHTDYPHHMHGKPRLEGVRAFLASRGISLPEGLPDDPSGSETVRALANQKNAALLRRLDEQGVTAFADTRHYLETARSVGVHCAVVSASANTATILDHAGLAALIEQSVDGNTILAHGLRAPPTPDTHLAACRQLGIDPRHVAAFETSTAGVEAARAAGFIFVIGVDRTGRADALRDHGADLVIAGLGELLNRKPAPASPGWHG